ncbi:MAG: threonine/serine dehydratase [Alphaproteobacteria bacterium]|nr:threonine/serine dehydratase [Alphaproteobacteria bacterium]
MSLFTAADAPTFDDVLSAADRLDGLAVRTPLISSPTLDARIGAQVLLKAEPLQRTGSFKFRGAYNALSRLGDEARRRGVVAFSSGNHAQGVAEAAKLLDIPATIVMPSDAPEIKKAGVIARGAELKLYDRETESREALAWQLCEESGRTLIPSFDHPHIIAGQGTCGLEVFQELSGRGLKAGRLVCCVGGGGLIGGINLAAEALSPETETFGAEPEGFDDHARSLASGELETNERKGGSVCDALLSPAPGELTFAINKRRLSGVGVVSDDEAMDAVRFAFEHLKIVVEPGGAAALAAVLSGRVEPAASGVTVIVLTGGNVDPGVFARAIGA